MQERTRIGFYYVWGDTWMGGVIYSQNLLKALNMLDDKEKPYIDVYCRNKDSFDDLKKRTGYPYLGLVIINEDNYIKKVIRGIVGLLCGQIAKAKINRFKILEEDKLLFPYCYGSDEKKDLYWIPDFQEKYYPDFFMKSQIRKRDLTVRVAAKRGVPMFFSSKDAESDFKRFYPEYNNKTYVVHFAVDHADFSYVDINKVRQKYEIRGEYLLCANQFWKHKNHLFLFKAFHKALKRGLKLQLVCTGNLFDNRNPEYIDEIKRFVLENELEESIRLLGLIDIDELHCLMKYSYAVVQPSLFEGWNTTVEDCKALNKFIFVSDLPVHHEQIDDNVCFFNPFNEDELVEKLLNVIPVVKPHDYSLAFREFGKKFHHMVNDVIKA